MKRTILAFTAVLLLAGCGGGGGTTDTNDESSTSASSEAPDDAGASEPLEEPSESEVTRGESEFSSVEDLRDAAVEAGYTCPRWKQTDVVDLATESGQCSGRDVFAVFETETDKDDQLQMAADFAADYGFENDPVVAGKNWTINTPEASALSITMGADLQ